jgi:hypothetical protein
LTHPFLDSAIASFLPLRTINRQDYFHRVRFDVCRLVLLRDICQFEISRKLNSENSLSSPAPRTDGKFPQKSYALEVRERRYAW